MITNDGKKILSKYFLGQIPAFATHISIGCGADPLDANDPMPTGIDDKSVLDFEMLRVPISSRGFIDDVNGTKIAFTAELPTENRYEITEIGLWSAPNNSLARGFDSRILFDFQEGWQTHSNSVSSIPLLQTLGSGSSIEDDGNIIFRANCNDPVLEGQERRLRKEGPRFLNTSIFLRGDSSVILGSDGSWSAQEDENILSTHIHLNNITFNIGQNSPNDELVLAFSLVDKDSIGNGNPEFVKILVEFFRKEISEDIGFAKAEIFIDGAEFSNRYKSVKVPISDLITSTDFTASEIRVVKIYGYVAVSDGSGGYEGSENHYLALDGLRIDNTSTENPLYKMVGYSPIRTSDGSPVIKFNNTNNYVEFRFGIGVS
jgi:hypothetical protein